MEIQTKPLEVKLKQWKINLIENISGMQTRYKNLCYLYPEEK